MMESVAPYGALPPIYPAANNTPRDDTRASTAEDETRTNADSTRISGVSGTPELSEADQQRVRELQQRDREVRAHEMAHVAAGAGLILRGASFEYEVGPDGQRYAVGGDVIIDTSPGRTPEETIDKAARIQAAALAPADPSPQDIKVAAQAAQMAAEARVELSLREREERSAEATPNATEPAIDPGAAMAELVNAIYGAGATTPGLPGGSINVFA